MDGWTYVNRTLNGIIDYWRKVDRSMKDKCNKKKNAASKSDRVD